MVTPEERMLRRRDSWYAIFVLERFSVPLVKWLARFGVTPNQVTLASYSIRSLSLWLVWSGETGWGIGFWQLGFLLDCMDGQLARLTGNVTPLGAELDKWGDIVFTVLFVAVIGVLAQASVDWLLAVSMGIWVLLWLTNWLLVSETTEEPSYATGDGLLARYSRWADRHRVKLAPISGVEEGMLLLPLAYAFGGLPVVVPALVALRLLPYLLRWAGSPLRKYGYG